MFDKLSTEAIDEWVKNRRGWKHTKEMLVKVYRFASFPDSIVFVNRLATIANSHDHHPDIFVRYDAVRVSLWTHSAGGITAKDIALAEQIDFATSHD